MEIEFTIYVSERAYNNLKKQADRDNIPVNEYIEKEIEDLYGY